MVYRVFVAKNVKISRIRWSKILRIPIRYKYFLRKNDFFGEKIFIDPKMICSVKKYIFSKKWYFRQKNTDFLVRYRLNIWRPRVGFYFFGEHVWGKFVRKNHFWAKNIFWPKRSLAEKSFGRKLTISNGYYPYFYTLPILNKSQILLTYFLLIFSTLLVRLNYTFL